MKWGLRRYQNNDGSLTPAGKTRYNKKSDHQLKLEAKYQQKGKTKEEAEAAAKKRIKIEKTIAASAGIVLGAAATVALIKKYKDYADDIIVGTKDNPIYRMEMMTDAKNHDASRAVYGVYKKKDTPQYFGVLAEKRNAAAREANHNMEMIFGNGADSMHAHKMKITYDSGVKMASTKNSRKIFNNLMKNDPTFKENVEKMGASVFFDPRHRDKYDSFIRDLAGTGVKGSGRDTQAAKQFFDELSKRGYGAIHDSNDAKFSEYGAKSAGIFFKDGYNWTAEKLSEPEIIKNARIGKKKINREVFKQVLEMPVENSKGAILLPYAGGIAGIAYAKNTKRGRARSMKQAGVSDSDIAKQLNISEADVKKLTSNNKGCALASDYTRKYGVSKAFAMKKTR